MGESCAQGHSELKDFLRFYSYRVNNKVELNLWRKLDDELLQFLDVGSAEAFNFLSLFEEDESGHRRDVVLHGKFLAFINIDLKTGER